MAQNKFHYNHRSQYNYIISGISTEQLIFCVTNKHDVEKISSPHGGNKDYSRLFHVNGDNNNVFFFF